MKKVVVFCLCLLFVFCFHDGMSFITYGETQKYNPDKALKYAEEYHSKTNNIDGIDFRNDTYNSADCAHFVSLCIGNLADAVGVDDCPITSEQASIYGGGITLFRPWRKHSIEPYTPFYGGLPSANMFYNGQEGAKRASFEKGDSLTNQNLAPWLLQNKKATPHSSVSEIAKGDIIHYGVNKCWVNSQYIKPESISVGMAIKIEEGTNLRSSNSTNSTVINKADNTTTGIVDSINGEWIKVLLDKNIVGTGHVVLYIGNNKIADHSGGTVGTGSYDTKDTSFYLNEIARIYCGDETKSSLVEATFVHLNDNPSPPEEKNPPPTPPPSDPEVKGSITIKLQPDSNESIKTLIKLENVKNETVTEVYNGSIESSKAFVKENLEPGTYRLTWLQKNLVTTNNTFYILSDPKTGIQTQIIGKINKDKEFIGKYKKVKTGILKLEAKVGSDQISIPVTLNNPDGSTEIIPTTPKELQKPLGTYTITWPKTFTNNDLKIQYNLSGLEQVEVTLKDEGKIVPVTAIYNRTYQDKGTVKVVATLQGEPWKGFVNYELSGTEKIKGTYISQPTTHEGVTPGKYSIKKVSGGPSKDYPPPIGKQQANCEIDPSTIEVKVGAEITVTFKFSFPSEGGGEEEGKGTVIVESNINAGFRINGPGFSRSSICPFEKEDAKVGSWTVTWESYDSYNTPSTMTKILDAGGTIKFYGNYTKKDGGGQPPPDDEENVTLTLYVHEGAADGKILEGVAVSCTDGKGNSFNETTNSYGYVKISGIKSGKKWRFTAYKSGYKENNWEQSITKTEKRDAFIIKDSNGGGDSDKKVTMTLYMYENSTSGNALSGVYISGTDGKNKTFSGMTDSSGYVKFTGYKSGDKWQFKASKEGYEPSSWSKSVTEDVTNYGYLKKKSGGGEEDPPASTYNIGNWISIGPSVYYYQEPCGSKLYQFDFVNGYKLEDKKFCSNMWWYKIYMEDDDGITGYAWIRGIDINGKISSPSYSIGSTKTFKKGASAYLTICGSVYDTLKYDGNKFAIIDRAYRCNTWWYKVYVDVWKKNVWFKEADIL